MYTYGADILLSQSMVIISEQNDRTDNPLTRDSASLIVVVIRNISVNIVDKYDH